MTSCARLSRIPMSFAAAAIAIGVVILILGCSSSTKPNPAPDRIQDLRALAEGSDGVMLKWSPPRAGSGAATRYDIRFGTVAITESNWASADTVRGEPIPGSPGTTDSFLVGRLDAQTTYHFAIRSQDSEARVSPVSNDASVRTTYGAPTSIPVALSNLRQVWRSFDYDECVRLFDPAYTFVFAPQDVGGPENIPASWGLADELLSAHHLFGHEANLDGYVADSLSLSFVAGPETPNDIGDWSKVVLSGVFLTVFCHKSDTGDPLWYLIQGDQAYLWFTPEGGLWHLVRWEDKPITGSAGLVETTTWGRLKGLWK